MDALSSNNQRKRSAISMITSDQNMREITSPLYSSKEASAFLGFKTDALRYIRSVGVMWGVQPPRFIKIGRRVFYKKAHLEDWIERHTSYRNNAEYQFDQNPPQD